MLASNPGSLSGGGENEPGFEARVCVRGVRERERDTGGTWENCHLI